MPPGIIAAAGAAGGLAGGLADKTTTSSVDAGKATELEKFAKNLSKSQLKDLQGLIGAGAGQADVAAGTQAQRDFASTLEQFAQGGGPSAAVQARSRQTAGQLLAPERVGLRQSFEDQAQRTAQLAARLGRPVNDPILQSKLAIEQTRAEERLGAREGALAQQLGFGTVGFAGQRADVLSGLGQQALQTRASLFGLGQQAMGAERQFRLATANRSSTQEGSFAAGLGGAITGGIGGFGTGLKFDALKADTAAVNRGELGNVFKSRFGTNIDLSNRSLQQLPATRGSNLFSFLTE